MLCFFMHPRRILPVIVLSQFLSTSVWFAGNAVLKDITSIAGETSGAASAILSFVQLGFITGTLVFAFLNIADRFSPRKVFLVSALMAAISNILVLAAVPHFNSILVLRFVSGFFLAGIYPVGMKIASGWYRQGLGNAIGFLVGSLVLGSGLPFFIRSLGGGLPWQAVMVYVSGAAVLGGFLMFALVPDGPYLARGTRFNSGALGLIFRDRGFRASALGYFGHMWELYGFWAFAPFVLRESFAKMPESSIALSTFLIFAAGALGCVIAGLASLRSGSSLVARFFLAGSCISCLLSPLIWGLSVPLVLGFFLLWGFLVVGDSAQFSTLNAQRAPVEYVGSALTIVNSIGFAITIISIQLIGGLSGYLRPSYLLLPLAIGPALGLFAMRREWSGRVSA